MPQIQTAAATERSGHPPDWVLLDPRARIGQCGGNATTAAEARTSYGHLIVVSFSVPDPPALSRCFVHCPGLTAEDFIGEPHVTGADGAVLLVRVTFAPRHGRRRFTDMFVYRAGPGEPSLHLLPGPYPLYMDCDHVGVLSRGEEHYSVVVPEARFEHGGRMDYDLYVFSSETASWSTTVAPVAIDGDTHFDLLAMHDARKVISIGGVWLAWIDFERGVLLCNVADDKLPEIRLIQLPSLLGTNKLVFAPPYIRDLTCQNDGLLRFVEIEYPELGELNDYTEFRWTATMFTREICSQSWDRCWTIDSADLCPAETCLPELFPEIWDGKKLTLNKVRSLCPTLDQYDDDVLYMMTSLLNSAAEDTNSWVLVVNTSDLTLQRVVPSYSDRPYFDPTYPQCAFSKYLSKTPGDFTDARCQEPS